MTRRPGLDGLAGPGHAGGGERVNTRGGVVHFTGIAWAGGEGEHVGEMPRADGDEPGFVSGACLAIARAEYRRLGGLPEEFFLYHEDVDLSLRVRLAGGALGVERAARVDHAYEFDKGSPEVALSRAQPLGDPDPDLPGAAPGPARAGADRDRGGAVPVALAGGWLPQKLRAWADFWRSLPRLLRRAPRDCRRCAKSRPGSSPRA